MKIIKKMMNFLWSRLEDRFLVTQSILLGTLLFDRFKDVNEIKSLQDVEFKVFSQFGDDGIIQYLVHKLEIKNKTFIEFGVSNYLESNTRFLLLKDNWSGLIIDGSDYNINFIKKCDLYWRHNLVAISSFITRDNINDIISKNGYEGEIGILHVDLDGNDYWIWEKINVVDPILVIVEYNSVFGPIRNISIPYNNDFFRTKAHYSNLYWGASLGALCSLADKKGYYFVGSNSAGNNAYFVRKDRIGNFKHLSASEGYVESKYRESRDKNGKMTFLFGADRLDCIGGMSVVNVDSGKIEQI